MDRNELTLAIAAALVGAMLTGWILHWIFARMNNAAGPRSIRRTADLAARLHEAEEAQAMAETRLRVVEADLGQRLGDVQGELDATLRALEAERRACEEIRAAYRTAMAAVERPTA